MRLQIADPQRLFSPELFYFSTIRCPVQVISPREAFSGGVQETLFGETLCDAHLRIRSC
jgi:hypothetical protein